MEMRTRTRISAFFCTARAVRLACALALAFLAACGGPNQSDLDDITGGGGSNTRRSTATPTGTPVQPSTPVSTATPIDQFPLSGASRISFNAGTEDFFLETFTREGLCLVNMTTEIAVLVGDFQGRPLGNVTASFFIERGRGLLDGIAISNDDGNASATFHSLCPEDAAEEITMVAVVRGSEPFTDLNSNGRHDQEDFTDANDNDRYDDGEDFVDANSNGQYDIEPFTDLPIEVFLDGNRNGIFEPELDEYMIWDPNKNAEYDCGPAGIENNCGDGVYNTDAIISDVALIVPSFEDEGGPVLNPFTPTPTETPEGLPSATPVIPTQPPVLSGPTGASQLSYQSGTNDITIEMFDEAGRCQVNITRDIVALVGDFRGRPVNRTEVAFFVESGRGILPERAISNESGVATNTFRSLCPANALEDITIVAAVRGAELFTDSNSNGQWDSGEPFVDLPRDAFLDGNRNGVYEPQLNEFLIFDADRDGQYDAGGNGVYDTDNIITAETVLKPVRLGQIDPFPRTNISHLSFGAGTEVKFEMFTEDGLCIVNALGDIVVVAGDFAGRPADPETPIAFFTARGRGTLAAQALTDEAGVAETQLHALCPFNATENIAITVAARGSEPFIDLNSNGRRDGNEPFTDLPTEAFLDANFNGVYEPQLNEYLIWDPNQNGQFDEGGNGVYDTDTIITAEGVMVPHKENNAGPAKDPLEQGTTGATQLLLSVSPNPLVVKDEGGACFSARGDVIIAPSDSFGRTLGIGTPVSLFVGDGRATVEGLVQVTDTGEARANLRTGCPNGDIDLNTPIRIAAAVVGSEPFQDLNGNGVHDDGEPFTDLPQDAILDLNGNGTYEPGTDKLIVDTDHDGQFDGTGNGVYDARVILVQRADVNLRSNQPEAPSTEPFQTVTGAYSLSFQTSPAGFAFPMFDEFGRCVVGVNTEIQAVVGDRLGQALTGTIIGFFTELGRGVIERSGTTNAAGLAAATFSSLCPANAIEEISLVAAVLGHESFTDLNSNGSHDAGEPFVDLPRDAFLDGNRNGLYEPGLGEYLIWDEDDDNQFDGPNGLYDASNVITSDTILIPFRFGRPDDQVLNTRTDISRMSFANGTFEDGTQGFKTYLLPMIGENGNCVVNSQPTQLITLGGDFMGRPAPFGTPFNVFVERGRGVIERQVLVGDNGVAGASFHNLCPTGGLDGAIEDACESITVVSAVRGEEPFLDINSNGQYDDGEPFTDQPIEVFLDADLDGEYDPLQGDYLIWDPNHNGLYDCGNGGAASGSPCGNGQWDNDIVVYDTAVIVPTRLGTSTPACSPTTPQRRIPSHIDIAPILPFLVQFTETGACVVNASTDVIGVLTDFEGRAADSSTPVEFRSEFGRGTVIPAITLSAEGLAVSTFHSICSNDPTDPITIIATAFGREPFTDANRNGRYDLGEPFEDLPNEAFLDANLDGEYNLADGDILIWDPNGDALYNGGGNGRYDSSIILSDQTVIFPSFPDPPGAPPLAVVTNVSHLQVEADDQRLVMFDEQGRCVTANTSIAAFGTDYRGTAAQDGTSIGFFVELDRGTTVDRKLLEDGVAEVSFRPFCEPGNFDPITVVAVARGPEPFSDRNANGLRDEDEPFTDLPPDVFVDRDNDGIYEPFDNDYLIFDADSDGNYDAVGNGRYDFDAVISGETTIIPSLPVTGGPDPFTVTTDISRLRVRDLELAMIDGNGNCLDAISGTVDISASNFRGALSAAGQPVALYVPSDFGAVTFKVLTNATGQGSGTFLSACPVVEGQEIPVLAATLGPEPFTDTNGNGIYNLGEPFTDLPDDAFLDINGNRVFDPQLGETLIYDLNNNGLYDGDPNGRYDTSHVITGLGSVIAKRVEGTPLATSTPLNTATPIPSATSVPTSTATTVPTATATVTSVPTSTMTATSVPTLTATAVPTDTEVPTATATATETVTTEPTATETEEP